MTWQVSPLLGPKRLLAQDQQDAFDFIFIQGYFVIGAVMLYSMLVGIFSTRLTKDDSTRVPTFQKGFSKLVTHPSAHPRPTHHPLELPCADVSLACQVINENLISPVPPPLHALVAPWFVADVIGAFAKTVRPPSHTPWHRPMLTWRLC